MKQLDFYEFAGIICPGAVVLYGLARVYPALGLLLKDGEVSLGELGLLLILAYVAGHLVQALGNLLDTLYWRLLGGMPSDWVRSNKWELLAQSQRELLAGRVRSLFGLDSSEHIGRISQKDWFSITRQIYAAVRKDGRNERVDIFNANYGMFRGVSAAFAVILVAVLIDVADFDGRLISLLVGLFVLSFYRMHRFAVHYARELYTQFLSIPSKDQQLPANDAN